MNHQVTAQAVEHPAATPVDFLWTVGVIALMLGPALTGSPKAATAGLALILFSWLF